MTTKILALTDALGNLVRFKLLPGHRFDTIGVEPLLARVDFGGLIADKAFDSDAIIADLNERGAKVVISQHQRRTRKLLFDRDLYKWRHLIENFFCKLKEFKRIAMRADKTDNSFSAMISQQPSSIPDESPQALMQMSQLVWVPHHIDRDDLFVPDFERGGLKLAIGFQGDETRQAVDKPGMNQFRSIGPETSRQIFVKLDDGLEAEDRLRGCRTLAAAVGMDTDIGCQHRTQSLHIAAARGGEESLGKLDAALLLHLEARSRLADMGARTSGELPASGRVTPDGGGDFLEAQPEHVVQQEFRTLERRKTFQRKHQRQGDVFFFLPFDNGIRKPGTDIGLALAPRRLELIETEARDRCGAKTPPVHAPRCGRPPSSG